jgi:hypothetical protein
MFGYFAVQRPNDLLFISPPLVSYSNEILRLSPSVGEMTDEWKQLFDDNQVNIW